jgi:hypothetical protein
MNKEHHFQIYLDVHHFKPEELMIKLADDSIVIHGKHQEKEDDHGLVMREFTRKYSIPKDVEADKLEAHFKPHGILVVEAPKKLVHPLTKGERLIPISFGGRGTERIQREEEEPKKDATEDKMEKEKEEKKKEDGWK